MRHRLAGSSHNGIGREAACIEQNLTVAFRSFVRKLRYNGWRSVVVDVDDVGSPVGVLRLLNGDAHPDRNRRFQLFSIFVHEDNIHRLDLQNLSVNLVGKRILQVIPVNRCKRHIGVLRERPFIRLNLNTDSRHALIETLHTLQKFRSGWGQGLIWLSPVFGILITALFRSLCFGVILYRLGFSAFGQFLFSGFLRSFRFFRFLRFFCFFRFFYCL